MQKLLSTANMFLILVLVLPCCNKQGPADPRCSQEPDPGLCQAAIVRYYYDKDEKKCKPFTWGGCGGVVPFQTLEECTSCGCDK